jgi:ATP-dependent Clp protease ATP-binding subunit ClpA
MFERFTTDARAIVVGAQQQAAWLGSTTIEPGHLLLSALAIEGEHADVLRSAGVSADTLENAMTAEAPGRLDGAALATLGIDLGAVRARADELFGRGALDARGPQHGHVRFSAASKKVLELALREAIHIGDTEIRTDHLLLGLTRPYTAGAEAVRRSGADPDRLRQALLARHDAA